MPSEFSKVQNVNWYTNWSQFGDPTEHQRSKPSEAVHFEVSNFYVAGNFLLSFLNEKLWGQ